MKEGKMFFLNPIIISNKIQHNSSTLKPNPFTVSFGIHATILASIIYFMTSHPIPLPKSQETIKLSLADFSSTSGDIHTIEKPRPSQTPSTAITKTNIIPTPKQLISELITTTTPQEKQLPTSSVSPEASAPLVQTPMSASSEQIQSIHSPESTLSPYEKDLSITPPSNNQINGAALGHIRTMIENAIVYPTIARKLRLEGIVLVTFILKSNGIVEDAKVLSTSGSNLLDTKAIQTILSLSGHYPVLGKTVELSIPIAFNLK